MKKKIFYVLMIACIGMTAIINTSCSNETDLAANKQQEKAGPKGVLISFGLSAEDYGTDNEVATRGVSDAQTGRVIATSTANLGNGIEVLTEVVEESAPKTRAGSQPVPPQDFWILAYKDGQQVAKWHGNSGNGTNFNNYSDSPALRYLQPGTYKFYVYSNSYMELTSDERLTTSINKGSRNAFYLAEEKIIPNQKEYKLDFVLKPMFARVRTKLKTYIDRSFGGPFYGFSSYKQGAIPYTRNINPATGEATNIPAATDGTLAYGKLDESGEGTEGENGAIKFYYTMTPDYTGNYFLEGTKLNQISFKFGDGNNMTIFGQKVNNMTLENKLKADVTLEAGKSYTLVYTMYSLGNYLFNDGSVSSLAVGKIAGKTPVGFVVDAQKRIAIALNNVSGLKKWAISNSRRAETLWPQSEEGLRDGITEYNGGNTERGGYKETWDPNKTLNRDVRTENADFPAFNAIKDLTPVNGNKWYVPGVGDWALALKLFGIDDPAAGYTAARQQKNPWSKVTTQGLGYEYQNIVFKQAGGTPLDDWYWTANQWDAGGGTAITLTTDANGAFFGGARLASSTLVRPFINY